MLASCPRSRRKEVSLTVTSSISRATSCRAAERVGRRRRRNASGSDAGADAIERRAQERVLALAEPDAALAVARASATCVERARHDARPTGRSARSRRPIVAGARTSSAPALGRRPGHPEDGGARLVLGDRQPAGASDRAEPVGAVAAHARSARPRRRRAPAPAARLRSRTSADGPVRPGGVARVEHEPAGAVERQVGVLGRDPDRPARRARRRRAARAAAPGRRASARSPRRSRRRCAGRRGSGSGTSAGISARTAASACGPPVEAQIPITEARRAGAAGAGGRAGSGPRADGGSRGRR